MCKGNRNQTKAERLFEERIDKRHIQREDFEMFLKKVHDGEAIILSSPDEVAQLQSDLEMDKLVYSNDMIVDMIIDKVRKHTKDIALRSLIDSVKVCNLQDFIAGRAYQKCSDESHYSELGQYFLLTIQHVSDIAAGLFISDEIKLEPIHCYALLRGNCALVEAIDNKENVVYIPEYGYAQYLMKIIDDNLDKHFTDLLIYYGREICEMAIAFILGHELGHHYYSHIEVNKNADRNSCWAKEYEADHFGIKFALEYMQASIEEVDYVLPIECKHIHNDIDYRVLGIIVAFISSRIFDKRAIEESELHPSLQSREDKIMEQVAQCFDEKIIESVRRKEKEIDGLIINLRELNEILVEVQEA